MSSVDVLDNLVHKVVDTAWGPNKVLFGESGELLQMDSHGGICFPRLVSNLRTYSQETTSSSIDLLDSLVDKVVDTALGANQIQFDEGVCPEWIYMVASI